MIKFQKTGSLAANLISSTTDYLVWYAKDKPHIKYHQLYLERKSGDTALDRYDYIELPNGTIQHLSKSQITGTEATPRGKRLRYTTLLSDGESNSPDQSVTINKETFLPHYGKHWKTSPDGILRLNQKGRIQKLGNTIWYKRYVLHVFL